VRCLGHVGEILLGKRHCAVIERDQIPRHLTTPFSVACSGRISAWRRTRAQWRLTNHRGLIGAGQIQPHFFGRHSGTLAHSAAQSPRWRE
jgi:hypothetical protein